MKVLADYMGLTDYREFQMLEKMPNTHESFDGVQSIEFLHDEESDFFGQVIITYW